MRKDTSWGNVAEWYADHVVSEDSYHQKVILPNLLRLIDLRPGLRILDIACGSGFFAHEFSKIGAQAQGVDISKELIELAQKKYGKKSSFEVAAAHQLAHISSGSIDVVTLILAIQNIAEVKETLAEAKRVLSAKGKMYIVMNHPAFRIPGSSSWGWELPVSSIKAKESMYRRVDQYLTEKKIPIVMHPGGNPNEKTISFHRPLQYYMKLIGNGGFAVSRLEEWISHKVSEQGPRQNEEDRMRKEIPLFMALELIVQGVY
jgi:ubiquinone/menaquinone biosynthesis C-methylase UbiE